MDEFNPANKVSQRSQIKTPAIKSVKKKPSKVPDAPVVDRVSISQDLKASKAVGGGVGDIREDLVNKFREVLADGTYVVKANEIADKIVQKIREDKNYLLP